MAMYIKCGKGEMSFRWADGQHVSAERARLLLHGVPMCYVVFCGTGLCSKRKCRSKHPLGLEHMHQGAAFHLSNWLQAARSEERNLSLKALLLRL